MTLLIKNILLFHDIFLQHLFLFSLVSVNILYMKKFSFIFLIFIFSLIPWKLQWFSERSRDNYRNSTEPTTTRPRLINKNNFDLRIFNLNFFFFFCFRRNKNSSLQIEVLSKTKTELLDSWRLGRTPVASGAAWLWRGGTGGGGSYLW